MTTLEKITTWDAADQVLAEIGRLRRRLAELAVVRDNAIAAAKERYRPSVQPLNEYLEILEAELHRFLLAHQDDLVGRSRKLAHGRVGLLLVKQLTVRSMQKALAWLLENRKLTYVRVKHDLNKETLREAPADVLKACGARVRPHDECWYEVDGERYAVED